MMEILQNGNKLSGETGAEQVTDDQINFVVRGFVQVWNKFEDMLANEVAASAGLENEKAPESRPNNSYDLLFRVGSTISSRPSLTMGGLSKALSVPLSTATRIVNVLVDQGYVQRLSDTEDRRIVRISFTPQGQKLYEFIDGHITKRIRKIASYLTEREMADLIALLSKVAFAVKETLK